MGYSFSLATNSIIFEVFLMCLNPPLLQGDAEKAQTATADAFSPEFQQ